MEAWEIRGGGQWGGGERGWRPQVGEEGREEVAARVWGGWRLPPFGRPLKGQLGLGPGPGCQQNAENPL